MKTIVCNMRYFVSGGPERYMYALKDMLESRGHEFIPFSVAYTRNQETPYAKYFVAPPGDPGKVYFKDLQLSAADKIKFAVNAIYSREAKQKLAQLIHDTRADLIQTLQIHTFLSFSIIDAAKAAGLPVVSRMSNYQLMCPAELFLRDDKVCEECKKSIFNAIKYKCIQGSRSASTVRVASLLLHRMKKTFDKIDRFIVPSRFLRAKMIEYGFAAERVTYVPSFINTHAIEPQFHHDGYIAYSGRLAVEKGIQDMLEGFSRLKTNLKLLLIGDDNNPEGQRLKRLVANNGWDRIEFLGYQKFENLQNILKEAMFTICPSKWYENTPMSIYESFALGKPVVGANLGSIPEQIIPEKTGLLFEVGNPADIADKLNFLINHPQQTIEMGRAAREIAERDHSPEAHFERIWKVYQEVL